MSSKETLPNLSKLSTLSTLSIDVPPKLAFKQRKAEEQEQEAKQTVLSELNSQIVEQLVKDLVYDDRYGAENYDVCELLSNYCRVNKFVCDDDYVFGVALRAFGVDSEYKKQWMKWAWELDFVQKSIPLNYSQTGDGFNFTNRNLFRFVCHFITLAKKDIVASSKDHTQDKRDPMDYAQDDESDWDEYVRDKWMREIDLAAIFELSRIGSESFNKLHFVGLWRKMVANVDHNIVHFTDDDGQIQPAYHIGRPYALLGYGGVERSWSRNKIAISVLYNFAWTMAELNDPRWNFDDNSWFWLKPWELMPRVLHRTLYGDEVSRPFLYKWVKVEFVYEANAAQVNLKEDGKSWYAKRWIREYVLKQMALPRTTPYSIDELAQMVREYMFQSWPTMKIMRVYKDVIRDAMKIVQT